MNVGVIGAGLMGSTHARLLASAVSGAEVVAISDAVPDSAQRIAEELGVRTIHADALELIADPAVDAVVVASPAATHEPFALACLEAGKPVLCEKPLAPSAGGRAADRRGRGRRSGAARAPSASCAATTPATSTSRRALDAGRDRRAAARALRAPQPVRPPSSSTRR